MRYFFPLHYDGGNRGCEAIAKGTAILLGSPVSDCIGYCSDTALDHRLGVDRYVTLVPYSLENYLLDKLFAVLNRLFKTNTTLKWRKLYFFRTFLKMISKDDVMLSTGGDMMCYENNEIIYTNDYLHDKGVRTILWACSMGRENLTPEKEKTLFNYSLIYARESLTYDFFKSLGLKNVCLFPDPAFILEPEECALPKCFDGDVIGVNLSSYTLGGTTLNTGFGKEVVKALEYILANTDMHILLIPHVVWNAGGESQDDRSISALVRDTLHSNRVSVLDIDALNYCEIRYVISKCRYFIGARTHSVISAYSMCVPTIALGYSIKSKGIAKDLNLDERLVVQSKSFREGELTDSLKYLMDNGDAIHSALAQQMPLYKERAYGIREYLKNTIK